jgi:hypothetical protein
MATNALSDVKASQCDVRCEPNSTLVRIAEVNFICPHCGSFYEVARVAPAPSSVEDKVECSTCRGSLPTREDEHLLQYFLVRRSSGEMWERLPVRASAN